MSGDSHNFEEAPEQRARCEASGWITRREDGLSERDELAFAAWLAADPLREESFRNMETVWQDLADLKALLPENGVIPDADAFAPRDRNVVSSRRRFRRWAVYAGGLAACLALAFSIYHGLENRPANEDGTRYMLAWDAQDFEGRLLPDGSFVELKAGSAAQIEFDAQFRRFSLLKGEAHFSVAKNPQRPFVVESGRREFVAVGTAFNVRLEDDAVELLVTEGVVRVQAAPALQSQGDASKESERGVELVAMQRSLLPIKPVQAEVPKVELIDELTLDQALAWKRMTFDFSATPLSEAVALFNRHNRKQLILVGDSLRDILIDGAFRSDNLDGFVRSLELGLGLTAVGLEDRAIRLSREN